MPLTPYERNGTWWVRGKIEYNGRPITGYIRRSTGASTEAGARDWIRQAEEAALRRHILGDEKALTFDEAVMLYPAKPKEAGYLMKVLPHLTGRLAHSITPREVRDLGPVIYPLASTDTWRRQVVGPVSAVINNAHELGRCPPIRIRGYSQKERVDQDRRRGRESRRERKAGNVEWLRTFMAHADPYNAAMAFFMFSTGARVGQAVALDPRTDLDLPRGRVRLMAQKGHPAQWVQIPHELVVMLANLPAKRPHDRKTNTRHRPTVFGYATHSGMLKAWRTICARAGIEYRSPHEAGRHGFYTEVRIRQGVDPVTAAKLGRWASHALPERAYIHAAEGASEAEIRGRIGTRLVHGEDEPARKVLKGKDDAG